MEAVLFVNACMRGRVESRTFKLAEAFLTEYTNIQRCQVEEVDLTDAKPDYLNYERLKKGILL